MITAAILEEAIAYVQGEAYDRATYDRQQRIVVNGGICPCCLQGSEPMRSYLEPWEPGNYWENAGRECPNCGEFHVCGVQPEYEPDPWNGDADPGL